MADRLERPRLALEAEAQLEDAPLPLRKRVERPADALAPERLLGLLERVGGLAVGEEVAELTLVVRTDRLVERDRRVRGSERLLDVLDREAGRLGELLLRRLASELDLEPAGGPRELLLALDDVDGHADRARVIRDGALHRLADPPRGVRRELEAAAPVELLDCAVQAERALLDQVQERDAQAAVTLGDRHDEPEVRLDHHALRDRVAALDALGERNLLGRGQELVAADVGQEELKAVGGARNGAGLVLLLGGLLLLGVDIGLRDLDVVRLELALEQFGVLVADVVLEHERLELGCLELAPVLLGALDQRLHVLRFEKFDELVLRQVLFQSFRDSVPGSDKLTESRAAFVLFQGQPHSCRVTSS